MSHSEQRSVITCAAARQLVDEAIAAAVREGRTIAVAVTDPAGHVVAAARMDGVAPAVNGFAEDKAYTSAMLKRTTTELARGMEATRQQEFGAMSRPRLCAWPGGQPIFEDGVLIGGLGVSGAPGPVDIVIGTAALKAMGLKSTED